MSIFAWLRVADPKVQPKLQVALQGKLHGADYYNYRVSPTTGPDAVSTTWKEYEFRFDDLPLEGLSQLQARFDLSGPGEVWVDDVLLSDLAFVKNESTELGKMVRLADWNLKNGRIGDCMRVLDGYWPQFLDEHFPTPPSQPPAVAIAPKPTKTPPKKPEPKPGLIDGLKSYLPGPLRF